MSVPGCASVSVANVYMPPTGNLARRDLTEDTVRAQVDSILSNLPNTNSTVVCGDFNARTGSLVPSLEGGSNV